jgi:hypothetical protein
MSTQAGTTESQQLKDRLRATWMAGDFGQIHDITSKALSSLQIVSL